MLDITLVGQQLLVEPGFLYWTKGHILSGRTTRIGRTFGGKDSALTFSLPRDMVPILNVIDIMIKSTSTEKEAPI